jgi:hypothetical protein
VSRLRSAERDKNSLTGKKTGEKADADCRHLEPRRSVF